jgi:hypothetical protein
LSQLADRALQYTTGKTSWSKNLIPEDNAHDRHDTREDNFMREYAYPFPHHTMPGRPQSDVWPSIPTLDPLSPEVTAYVVSVCLLT